MSGLVTNVSYTGPKSVGQSAASLARYLSNRDREQDRDQDQGDRSNYETLDLASGDRRQFTTEARQRSESGRRSSYVHVVISPERKDYNDRDLRELIKPWTRDSKGRDAPHMAVIHRDTENPHIHVAVARDKFSKTELALAKQQTRDIQRERELVLDRRREREQERERERELERRQELEREQRLARDREDRDRSRDGSRERGGRER
ncbi:MAG: relaxase/mobilization nuclease domain-containing protein [Rubrobacteraceae bacterium]